MQLGGGVLGAVGGGGLRKAGKELLKGDAEAAASPPKSVLPAGTAIPKGFANAEEHASFAESLRGGIAKAGYEDVQPIIQGGAARSGAHVPNDFDIALAGEKLFERAKSIPGTRLKSQPTRIGPLSTEQLQELGLADLQAELTKKGGRPANFMLFPSIQEAMRRGGIWVP